MSGTAVVNEIQHIQKVLGLTQEDFARLLGASSRSIRRWQKQAVSINADTVEKLETIDQTINMASHAMKPNEIEQWFRTEIPSLDGKKPIDLVSSFKGLQRIQQVLAELEWGLF